MNCKTRANESSGNIPGRHPLKISCLLTIFHRSLGTLVISTSATLSNTGRSDFVNDILNAVGMGQCHTCTGNVTDCTATNLFLDNLFLRSAENHRRLGCKPLAVTEEHLPLMCIIQ